MKTRNGFVSNSSSSSFIFMLQRAPTSEGDLHSLLYPSGRKYVLDPYPSIRNGRDMNVSTEEAARRVWDQINVKQKSSKWNVVRDELMSRGIPFADFLSNARHGCSCWCSDDPPPTASDADRFIRHMLLVSHDPNSLYFLIAADLVALNMWCSEYVKNKTKEFDLRKRSDEERKKFFEQFKARHGASVPPHKAANDAWWKSDVQKKLNIEHTKIWKSEFHGAQYRALSKCVTAMIKFLRDNYQHVYVARFSDEDGDDVLEHGKTFDDIPHLCISHH